MSNTKAVKKSAASLDISVRKGTLAVIGAGAWGTTLASMQAQTWERINLLTDMPHVCEEIIRFRSNEGHIDDLKVPWNIFPTTSLERALDHSQALIVAVPSNAIRSVAREVISHNEDLPVVIATKGLEKGTGLCAIEVWFEEMKIPLTGSRLGRKSSTLPGNVMVLSGPNLAKEIARGMPAVSVIAGFDEFNVMKAKKYLENFKFSLFEWHDPIGVQICGALKNVYAVGCGIATGLGMGDNAVASIIWRGLLESGKFIETLGGDPAVLLTPAGAGDFVATCTSEKSRNFALGMRIAKASSNQPKGVTEGAHTAQEALRRARSLSLKLGLLAEIWSVMAGFSHPQAILEASCATPEWTSFSVSWEAVEKCFGLRAGLTGSG